MAYKCTNCQQRYAEHQSLLNLVLIDLEPVCQYQTGTSECSITRSCLLYTSYLSVHFLVNKYNIKAIRSYDALDFQIVGECNLYDQPYLCYEKAL